MRKSRTTEPNRCPLPAFRYPISVHCPCSCPQLAVPLLVFCLLSSVHCPSSLPIVSAPCPLPTFLPCPCPQYLSSAHCPCPLFTVPAHCPLFSISTLPVLALCLAQPSLRARERASWGKNCFSVVQLSSWIDKGQCRVWVDGPGVLNPQACGDPGIWWVRAWPLILFIPFLPRMP